MTLDIVFEKIVHIVIAKVMKIYGQHQDIYSTK